MCENTIRRRFNRKPAPFVPDVAGRDLFGGTQLHSSHYRNAAPFAGRRVLVVGGGNSGAQIMAELSLVAQATWVTLHDPIFLPDDVDGRVLFERATARVLGGPSAMPTSGFGDIVMVPPVRAARERGVLHAVRPFVRVTATRRHTAIQPDEYGSDHYRKRDDKGLEGSEQAHQRDRPSKEPGSEKSNNNRKCSGHQALIFPSLTKRAYTSWS